MKLVKTLAGGYTTSGGCAFARLGGNCSDCESCCLLSSEVIEFPPTLICLENIKGGVRESSSGNVVRHLIIGYRISKDKSVEEVVLLNHFITYFSKLHLAFVVEDRGWDPNHDLGCPGR